MPLLLPVLVRGINNLSDARYCAGMGADGLIFTLDPALPGAVDVATVKELAGWVAGVEIIGEFGGEIPVSEINRLVEECGLTRIVLNLPAAAPFPEGPVAVPALVEVSAAAADTLVRLRTVLTAGFELISPLDGAAGSPQPLWLSGNPAPAQVADLIARLQPAGLILQGGDEIKPGIRDFDELEAIFEALEE
ncbi:beta/alpha barrel domain-containing protein [Hymenobacter lapidiphilus]|uniref:Phosphoribosylanthranilate isomerase n=1 Tax=Hymenobacter lapidiphilus TaxID=2608003 RepID=A0A7Y7PKW5_9BACT|nr:hypothetical protein [Hymenobacter lapidiphilus]NVO29620.1 hypothetical protein [Hymenobacter lapidiphilus]